MWRKSQSYTTSQSNYTTQSIFDSEVHNYASKHLKLQSKDKIIDKHAMQLAEAERKRVEKRLVIQSQQKELDLANKAREIVKFWKEDKTPETQSIVSHIPQSKEEIPVRHSFYNPKENEITNIIREGSFQEPRQTAPMPLEKHHDENYKENDTNNVLTTQIQRNHKSNHSRASPSVNLKTDLKTDLKDSEINKNKLIKNRDLKENRVKSLNKLQNIHEKEKQDDYADDYFTIDTDSFHAPYSPSNSPRQSRYHANLSNLPVLTNQTNPQTNSSRDSYFSKPQNHLPEQLIGKDMSSIVSFYNNLIQKEKAEHELRIQEEESRYKKRMAQLKEEMKLAISECNLE